MEDFYGYFENGFGWLWWLDYECVCVCVETDLNWIFRKTNVGLEMRHTHTYVGDTLNNALMHARTHAYLPQHGDKDTG